MSVIPGICLCGAPGAPASSSNQVLYSLHDSGFTDDSAPRARGQIFQNVAGMGMNQRVTPTGSASASVRSEYPFDIIEFYLSDPMVGEYLADPSNPRICTGYMAASVPSVDGSAHRHGRGQYIVVNRELAQRLVGPTGGAIKFPGTATEDFLQRWMEYVEEVRDQDEDILARLELAQAIIRGDMNQAVVAVLHFPR